MGNEYWSLHQKHSKAIFIVRFHPISTVGMPNKMAQTSWRIVENPRSACPGGPSSAWSCRKDSAETTQRLTETNGLGNVRYLKRLGLGRDNFCFIMLRFYTFCQAFWDVLPICGKGGLVQLLWVQECNRNVAWWKSSHESRRART